MTPVFALNLTHAGIALYARAADGWRVVGDVSLESTMLAGDLAALRTRAVALDLGPLACKLIMPNSQILYTQTPASGEGEEADAARVRNALEGATPYAVEELVYDWAEVGGTLKIAVVARATLAEAEGFAAEHGFAPLGFVAIPAADDFPREPFFGPAEAAEQQMQADAEILVLQGTMEAFEAAPAEDAPAAEPDPVAAKPAPVIAAPTVDTPPLDTPSAPAPQVTAPEEAPEAPQAPTVAAPEAAETAAPVPSPVAPPEPTPSFASIRAGLEPEPPLSKPKPVPAAEAPAKTPAEAAQKVPTEAAPVLPKLGGARRAPGVTSPDVVAPPSATPPAKPVAKPAKATKMPPVPPALAAKAAALPRVNIAPRAVPEDLPVEEAPEESDRMTVFGERKPKAARVRQTPRYMGLVLTAILLVFLALIALWSSLAPTSTVARFFGGATLAQGPGEETAQLALLAPERGADGALTRSITFGEAGVPALDPGLEEPLGASVAAATQAPLPEAESNNTTALASLGSDPFSALPEEAPLLAEPIIENPPLPEMDAAPEAANTEASEDELADAEPEAPIDPDSARAAYAATGVWQLAPEAGTAPAQDDLNQLYQASIDPEVSVHDAVDLPRGATLEDEAPARQVNPLPFGEKVVLGPDGQVAPSEDGAMTAEGIALYAGRPAITPPNRPTSAAEATAEDSARAALSQLRPRTRPSGLAEAAQKAQLGGHTLAELSGLRPKTRPRSIQDTAEAARKEAIAEALKLAEAEEAEAEAKRLAAAEEAKKNALTDAEKAAIAKAEAEAAKNAAAARAQAARDAEFRSASRYAVATSREPKNRPGNMAARVARVKKAQERAQQAEPERVTNAAAVSRSQRVAPKIPSSSSVAKQATQRNVLRLSRVNLIGVYGSPSKRRALVRLPSGRYVKVKVGDRVDGGQVSAIGEKELRYTKRGRNVVLQMPKG
ncbi:hypothetical protein IV417_15175 [Alphaproteobacteria bacterium KMM 3653]|uniref:Type IV pilus biogenesis protein PilP n=1 Tax=Harenicola maris TaxID=2841044 RepID=A0AAP2CS89_9RHOB|nr:hypothetical protein [Harenicola maris]